MDNEFEVLLTQSELSEFLKISERTLERWRSEQQGPPFIQPIRGGKVRYRKTDVSDWLQKQRVEPTRNTISGNGSHERKWVSHMSRRSE